MGMEHLICVAIVCHCINIVAVAILQLVSNHSIDSLCA